MTDQYGVTVAKRRLSRRLSELRIKNGYTANQVCDKLNWGRGKVGRFEANVWKRPEMSDIRDLLRIYGVSETEGRELEELAVRARGRAWWREYGEVFGDEEYPGFEADAVRICIYLPLILPGLLQTKDYIETHMQVGSKPTEWWGKSLEARLRRQEILDRPVGTAPELVTIITEASLMYRWGTREQRRDQVRHLVDMGRRPNIEVRMLRFADGPHPGMSSHISVFDFPGDEPSMVYLENDTAMKEVTDTKEVARYTMLFERIRAAALDPPATTAYLKQLSETLE